VNSVAFYYDPLHIQHDVGPHPERPDRVEAVITQLRARAALDGLQLLQPRSAGQSEIELVHPPFHVDRIRRLAESGGGAIDPDTAVAPGSFEAAAHAAGGLLAGVDAIAAGTASSAFCLVRPPGHHATADRAMGFCLFNNVAIAAAYARERYGLERMAIVDFDVHHGNGTQEIFWNDQNLLYLSAHQYPFYPGSGHWSEVGGPDAEGATVNVPVEVGTGDREYLRIFDRLFLPAIERFRPQLMIVSAGYDAHAGDPLAGLELSTEAYREIVLRLAAVSNGRMLAALEGGYDLNDLSDSVEVSLAALTVDSPSFKASAPASPAFERYLDQLGELQGL
jgi:acetoin utilization deacetylase AcuC-like enzyme